MLFAGFEVVDLLKVFLAGALKLFVFVLEEEEGVLHVLGVQVQQLVVFRKLVYHVSNVLKLVCVERRQLNFGEVLPLSLRLFVLPL